MIVIITLITNLITIYIVHVITKHSFKSFLGITETVIEEFEKMINSENVTPQK